ncbi:MAG: GntR family transcriptional regulator [Pigmentiphaga sp.]
METDIVPTKKSQPQYAVIAQALINDIARSKYPVGSMLPPELEMAEQFKVSRNTMRSALRTLVDMGLVSRRAGRGTQVQTREINPNYTQSQESLDSLFPVVGGSRFEVGTGKNISADADLALLLACPIGTRWLRFPVVELQKDAKVSFNYIYVAPQLRSLKNKLARLTGAFHTALESLTGDRVFQVVQHADATAANSDVAKALAVAEGSPLLRKATRFADEAGRLLMVVDSYSLPGQQHYTVHLRLNWDSSDE